MTPAAAIVASTCALLAGGVAVFFISLYNDLVLLRNNIGKAWSNIDVLLTQRYEELPKLVEACKGYMAFERETLQRVIEARSAALRARSVQEKAGADEAVTGALKGLYVAVEQYPDLKANETFLYLQQRITGLENAIADRREFYNDSVTTFNTRIEQFPDLFIARMMKYRTAEFFKALDAHRRELKLRLSK